MNTTSVMVQGGSAPGGESYPDGEIVEWSRFGGDAEGSLVVENVRVPGMAMLQSRYVRRTHEELVRRAAKYRRWTLTDEEFAAMVAEVKDYYTEVSAARAVYDAAIKAADREYDKTIAALRERCGMSKIHNVDAVRAKQENTNVDS